MESPKKPPDRRPFIHGESRATGDVAEIRSPYTGEVVTLCHRARPREIEEARASAAAATELMRRKAPWEEGRDPRRRRVGGSAEPRTISRGFSRGGGQASEGGARRGRPDRPHLRGGGPRRRRARGESSPSIPFRGERATSAHAALPTASSPHHPFNFPLKPQPPKIAPASRRGTRSSSRPASQTPSPAIALAEIAAAAGAPPGRRVNVVPGLQPWTRAIPSRTTAEDADLHREPRGPAGS